MPFTVTVAAQSDVGCVRENNEDKFGYDLSRQLYVVCDGMGGAAAGEVASEIAVHTLLSAPIDAGAQSGAGEEKHSAIPKDQKHQNDQKDRILFHLVLAANRAVRDAVRRNPKLRGMGTTLVAARIDGDRVFIANVGDSRAYLVRGGGCEQITTDHSFVEEQIRLGTMTREMAANSPVASIITRAVGTDDDVEPDLFSLSLADQDILLLTTDGLTRYVEADELAGLIAPNQTLDENCARLIARAKEGGAVDNVTCLLLRFEAGHQP